jgi:DNA helicase IV
LGANIESIQQEALAKPDSPDGNRVTEARWRQIESQLWIAGPLRGRMVGLARQLKGGGSPYRLQGIATTIDKEIRLSDRETASLAPGERRAVREAVLNISLRLFRLLNPSDLYVDVHKEASLADRLATRFPEQAEAALEAAERTAQRLGKRLITDDDVVTALCLNALVCDQFERDIKEIPYVRTFSDRVGVFIDEYQDFSEQQIFLMGFRAKRKYRQITVAGDGSQRLHAGGIERIANAFPYVGESIRQITLDTNFRQTKPLARLSNCFRAFTGGSDDLPDEEPCNAPLYTYEDQQGFAEFVASKISALPAAASVVVISPTPETARRWYELMAPSLESAFRNPIISDRARLTERLKTHFTTPLEAKGLEFDVAVVPDLSEFDEEDPLDLNGLYVAVSRPRYALLLGCDGSRVDHNVATQLCNRDELFAAPLRGCEEAA